MKKCECRLVVNWLISCALLLCGPSIPQSAKANILSIRAAAVDQVVGPSTSSHHSINAGFWARVRPQSCPKGPSATSYANLSQVDFWWSSPLEFGDEIRLAPSTGKRSITAIELRVMNSLTSEWSGDITLRLYGGAPKHASSSFMRTYPISVPPGELTQSLLLPPLDLGDNFAFTIEGLPTNVLLGWNDAPSLGTSGDFYWIKDQTGSGTGWSGLHFGGAPSIANIAAEVTVVTAARGDGNGDGFVDLWDLVDLSDCMLGPRSATDPSCHCGVDTDVDRDVDLRDYAALQRSFVGNIESCADSPEVCDDLNACTSDDCDANTESCIYSLISCDDGNVCSVDRCNPDAGCAHTPAQCGTVDGCCPVACNYSADSDCCRPNNVACSADQQCCSGRCKPNLRCG